MCSNLLSILLYDRVDFKIAIVDFCQKVIEKCITNSLWRKKLITLICVINLPHTSILMFHIILDIYLKNVKRKLVIIIILLWLLHG